MRKTGAEQDRADSSLLRNQLGEQLLDPVIDLDALHGMGPKGVRLLAEALAQAGLSFRVT